MIDKYVPCTWIMKSYRYIEAKKQNRKGEEKPDWTQNRWLVRLIEMLEQNIDSQDNIQK